MKITFKAKIVADVSNDPQLKNLEPSYRHLAELLEADKCSTELVQSWDNSIEPTLIITENK